jgi:hypothetical protein
VEGGATVSGRSIDELADTIRRRLDAIQEDAERGYLNAPEIPGFTGWNKQTMVGLPPAVAVMILANVARDREMLDRLLAEPHRLWESCAAKDHSDNPLYSEMPCTCGRDERVRGYLELMAGTDETETAT